MRKYWIGWMKTLTMMMMTEVEVVVVMMHGRGWWWWCWWNENMWKSISLKKNYYCCCCRRWWWKIRGKISFWGYYASTYTSSCVSIFFMLFEKLLYVTKELWYSIDFPIFTSSVSPLSCKFSFWGSSSSIYFHEWDLGFDFDKLFLL